MAEIVSRARSNHSSCLWLTSTASFEDQMSKSPDELFASLRLEWCAEHKRSFPWRQNVTPYHIAVSEALLQKTAAVNALLVYEGFIERFPTVQELAKADVAD